jgi:hypothetical protein
VVCQQANIRRSKDVGLLQPLPIPSRPWKDISTLTLSAGKSPFEVNYGFNPRMDYLNIEEFVKFESVDSWVGNIKLIQFGVEAALQRSTDEMIKYANRKRIDHKFKVGDLVWLSCENLKLTRPCRKLAFKRMGPFKIIEFVNKVSERLKLPDNVCYESTIKDISLARPWSREIIKDIKSFLYNSSHLFA